MKLLSISIITIIIFIFSIFAPLSVFAIVDPLAVPNNKYGIHVVEENDLYDAAKLVNSSGGDWGYVTMVIRDDDRDLEKWQKTFDLLQNWHLIPIIRIATHLEGDIWKKPNISDAKEWTDFLSRLHWPIKNRYVVVFNEPNHSKEWAGFVNPAEYAQILAAFSQNLKNSSGDFFILPAGLDASAPTGKITMDEQDFIKQMIDAVPDIFSAIDGWTSHSYPNPGFIGKVTDDGRGTLTTYKWEMEILKSLNQKPDFPIFITETGWTHAAGIETIMIYLRQAAENIWNDPKVVAITPFILNYQSYPFPQFSWKKLGEESYYPYYETYQSLAKIAGQPELARAFEKFEGLKIASLSANNGRDINKLTRFLSLSTLRSLFYRIFKL